MNKMDLLDAEMKARQEVDLAWMKVFLRYHPEVMNEQRIQLGNVLGVANNVGATESDSVPVPVQPAEPPA